MRIGELAEATGASVRSLRYYEKQGLLVSERSSSGQRLYEPEAVETVRWIRMMLSAGLPSRAIAKLKRCRHRDEVTAEQKAVLEAERARIASQVENLTAVRDRLDSMLRFVDGEPEPRGEAVPEAAHG